VVTAWAVADDVPAGVRQIPGRLPRFFSGYRCS